MTVPPPVALVFKVLVIRENYVVPVGHVKVSKVNADILAKRHGRLKTVVNNNTKWCIIV